MPVGSDGRVDFHNHSGRADLVADLAGFYSSTDGGAAFTSVDPVRILDTRNGTGGFSKPVGPNATIVLKAFGTLHVPSGATAVVLTVTATNPTASSFVTAYPDGATCPDSSSLNFTRGETIPNLVIVPVGAGGQIDLYNHVGSTDLVADLVGYYMN